VSIRGYFFKSKGVSEQKSLGNPALHDIKGSFLALICLVTFAVSRDRFFFTKIMPKM